MKLNILVLATVCAGTLLAQRFLTNDDIVRMAESGVAQDIIIQKISESDVQFTLAPEHLIGLKKSGVPDDVVRAMMARNREVAKLRSTSPLPQSSPRLRVWHPPQHLRQSC